MQTFLPFESFDESARVLDPLRLGKQRVEALQILRALHFDDYGWQTHPAVCMWRGHEAALIAYGVAITEEWIRRGHDDTCLDRILEFGEAPSASAGDERPHWLGWPELHRSHRSALLRKDHRRVPVRAAERAAARSRRALARRARLDRAAPPRAPAGSAHVLRAPRRRRSARRAREVGTGGCSRLASAARKGSPIAVG
ncbi:MAG: MSMEG_6728 family protein [Myxococcota bacterium]|nr:MSMEG_6728 family protein [Myxococcota bacterium]